MNVKVFNLMLRVNETKVLVQHELCKCKCRLNEIVCNSKQNWNHDDLTLNLVGVSVKN